jgi:hypothetical protein
MKKPHALMNGASRKREVLGFCIRCASSYDPRHRVDIACLFAGVPFYMPTLSEFTTRNDLIFFSLKPDFVWIKLELRSEDLL